MTDFEPTLQPCPYCGSPRMVWDDGAGRECDDGEPMYKCDDPATACEEIERLRKALADATSFVLAQVYVPEGVDVWLKAAANLDPVERYGHAVAMTGQVAT